MSTLPKFATVSVPDGSPITMTAGKRNVPDHPIIPMIPETEYLKGFAFEVVR